MPSCNTYRLTWVSLTSDVEYLYMAAPAKRSRHPWPWTWGSSTQPPLLRYRSLALLVATPKEAEVERFYEDLQDLLELTPKKDVLFIIGAWNAKVGSQKTPGVTGKFGLGKMNEAGQRLRDFCQETALVIANTLFQQHKRRLYKWTSPDGQHQNQIDYILCSQRWGSSIQSAKTRPGADCGSDHELLIAKFRLKLKKAGKITRPFRYDLNQILMTIQWKWEIDLRD